MMGLRKKPFVISIASISGGGKTTMALQLKERLANSAILHFDDYDDVHLSRDINEWSADGNDYNEWHVESVATDIKQLLYKSYDYIILDYPFGYGNDSIGKYISLAVFIDTPLDVALARRIIRDYTSRSNECDFGLADVDDLSLTGLDKELRFYLQHSRSTYTRMLEAHRRVSDIIIDGTQEPKVMIDEIISNIKHYYPVPIGTGVHGRAHCTGSAGV